jgi:hypothetical protein
MYRLAKARKVGQFGSAVCPPAVLTKGDVAVDECGFDGRKFSGSQVPFAEEL